MRPTDKQTLIAGARARTKDLAAIAPLLAAIISPLSILFDIPALTERWYLKGSIEQPDPRASLALSGVGLGANIIANVLLVVRFSTADEWWRVATRASIVWWTTKVSLFCQVIYRHKSLMVKICYAHCSPRPNR